MTQSHRISLATSDQQRGITVDLLNRGATIAGIRVHGVGNLPESIRYSGTHPILIMMPTGFTWIDRWPSSESFGWWAP